MKFLKGILLSFSDWINPCGLTGHNMVTTYEGQWIKEETCVTCGSAKRTYKEGLEEHDRLF